MMDEVKEVLRNGSHHAYLLEGRKELVIDVCNSLLEEWGIETRGNPDFALFDREGFGIREARAIQHFAGNKAILGGKKILILSFSSITTEAQNALLKTLEEPTKETHFFIIVPNASILLPTVQSRLYHIRTVSISAQSEDKLAKEFLSSSKPERLTIISDIAKTKNKERAMELINGIERHLRGKGTVKADQLEVYEELEKIRGYLHDRSPSVKVLLEHLSLTIPS